jgi:nucleotide-binding universal stress UspA family protein
MILVGVDGSDGGRRALRFALAEAVLRKTSVDAVRTVRAGDDAELAEHELWTDVEAVRRQVPGAPGVTEHVLTGDPAQLLIDRSATAELLVVGSHGTSSLIHSALGSVSNACAQLAHCPVVVLPRSYGAGRSLQDGSSARSADG